MVRRIDSPFTPKILDCPLPPKFQLPQLESYDRLKYLLVHITTFMMTLSIQQTPDEIVCRSFPTTLKGAARVWFSKLAQSSIFNQLSSLFVRHFVNGQRQKKPADHLLTIKQGERESLRSYVKQFNREVLEVDKAEDKVQLTSFQVGLQSKEFVTALAKSLTASMTKLLIKAQKNMNAENALIVIKVGEPQTTKEGAQDDPKRAKERKERSLVQP